MAVAFRSEAHNGAEVDEVSFAVNVPSGTVNGDLLLTQASYNRNAALVPPAGWTLIRSDLSATTGGGNMNTDLYYRVASSEPASYTWAATLTGTSLIRLMVMTSAWSGVDTTGPINNHSGDAWPATSVGSPPAGASDTAIPALSITPASSLADGMLVGFYAGRPVTNTVTPPTGMTELAEYAAAAGVMELCNLQLASSGATGDKIATLGTADANGKSGQLVILTPSATVRRGPTRALGQAVNRAAVQ